MESVEAHWAAGTFERGLPRLDMPALLSRGVADPLPSSASVETAALIPESTSNWSNGPGTSPGSSAAARLGNGQ